MPRGVSRLDEARLQGRLWTPWAIQPSLRLWIDAQALDHTMSGSSVATIADATRGRGVSLDTRVTNVGFGSALLARRPAFEFTSTGGFIESATAATACTSFVAVSVATLASGATNSARLMSLCAPGGDDWNRANSAAVMSRNTGLVLQTEHNGSGIGGVTLQAYDTPFIFTVEHNGTNWAHRLNGAQVGSRFGSTISLADGRFGIGRFQVGLSDAARYLGIVGEQLFSVAHTPALVEQLEGYVAWRWGLPALLPASHPYRNAPPLIGG